MKIKVNQIRETVSIKGLTPFEFAVINELLNHVRLGQEDFDGGASKVPFDFSVACDAVLEELAELDLPNIAVIAVPSDENDSVSVVLDSPTIEVYAE